MMLNGIPENKQWKYAKLELERRFLLKNKLEGLEQYPFKYLFDRYLSHTNMRLRKVVMGEKMVYKLTKKLALHSNQNQAQWISTIYLSKAEYDLFSSLPGATIEKKRYALTPDLTLPIGIDELEMNGQLIWIAEVEFETIESMQSYSLPFDFDLEITNEGLFTGNVLAAGKN